LNSQRMNLLYHPLEKQIKNNKMEQEQQLIYMPMQLDDLDEVLDVERKSFLSPWTPDLFINEFSNPRSIKRILRSPLDNHLIGYIIWWVVLDEGHLMSIAINEEDQRSGAGRFLVEKMIAECRDNNVETISLEVREKNYEAIGLYQSFEFKAIGRRKKYYVDENEDAILMELKLT